jgi:hypothetical protein
MIFFIFQRDIQTSEQKLCNIYPTSIYTYTHTLPSSSYYGWTFHVQCWHISYQLFSLLLIYLCILYLQLCHFPALITFSFIESLPSTYRHFSYCRNNLHDKTFLPLFTAKLLKGFSILVFSSFQSFFILKTCPSNICLYYSIQLFFFFLGVSNDLIHC